MLAERADACVGAARGSSLTLLARFWDRAVVRPDLRVTPTCAWGRLMEHCRKLQGGGPYVTAPRRSLACVRGLLGRSGFGVQGLS